MSASQPARRSGVRSTREPAPQAHRHVELRRQPPRGPRRHRLLRPVRPARALAPTSTVNRQPIRRRDLLPSTPARMDEGRERIKPNSVALVVTSPPYFAGKAYEDALERDHIPASYLDYLEMLRDVFAVCVDKLEPGGRIAVNVANLGRKPYRSLSADVIGILQDDLGLLLRGEIIWQKARGTSGSTARGARSRARPTPSLRDLTERVIVASKGRFDRAIDRKDRAEAGPARREHDLQATTSWTGHHRRLGHRRPRAPRASATRRRSRSSSPSG